MTISDFWPVTIWYAGQAAGLGWAGWPGGRTARLGWAGLAELSEQWQVMVNGTSRPLPVSLTAWINVV